MGMSATGLILGGRLNSGITDGHERNGLDIGWQVEQLAGSLEVKAAYPAGADAQLPCLEHHMGEHDGGIHLAGGVSFLLMLAVLPADILIIAYQQSLRSMEHVRCHACHLGHCIGALQHINHLRLEVHGCRRHASSLQYLFKFLRLHLAVRERAYRVARLA